MFRQARLLCLLLFGICAALWGLWIAGVRAEDIASIQKKIEEEKEANPKTLFSTTQQQRKGVVKEIWFTQDDGARLHYRIFSESSLLTLKPDGKGLDLVEKLEKIQCWMQDKIYPSPQGAGVMQQIRFLVAEEGLYRYNYQEFLAHTVALSLYRMAGSELPEKIKAEKPFLKGIADDVSFAVSGKNPQFQAKHFKAELNMSEEKR